MMRIDKYLVEEGYFESRNRALDAIKSQKVKIDGKVAKPSTKVDTTSLIEVENEKFYVSRAARKLEMFLAAYPMALVGKTALDIGSSTGGFAQILLEQGVKDLSCVDVGKDQLHISLRDNVKLCLHEETDIRDFQSPVRFDLITCDVSFISILQILKDIDRLAAQRADIIILYKPQFEVGREVKRDAKGVVMDMDAIERKKEAFEEYTSKLGWKCIYMVASSVAGKEGNREYLYHFVKMEK